MENIKINPWVDHKFLKRMCMISRICLCLLFLSLNSFAMDSFSQVKISLKTENSSLKEVITELKKQSGYDFLYDKKIEQSYHEKINLDVTDETLEEVLGNLFGGSDVVYKVINETIVLSLDENKRTGAVTQPEQQGKRITGTVTDAATGESIIGANILEKGVTNGTVTDADGNFTLSVSENATLQVSYIGYITQEISALAGGGGVNPLLSN